MEQVRLLVAIGISFAVFFLWSIFFAPQPQPQKAIEQQTRQESGAQPTGEQGVAPAPAVQTPLPTPSAIPSPSTNVSMAREINVETSLYRMVISEKGAEVESVVLKNYRETMAEDSPMKELIARELIGGSVQLNVAGDIDHRLSGAIYTTDQPGDELQVTSQPVTLKFQHQSATGLVVEKVYTFQHDSYLVDLKVNVYNSSDRAITGSLMLGVGNVMGKDEGGYGFAGPSGYIDGKLEQVKIKNIEDNELFEGKIRWVAIEDRYFMTSLILNEPVEGQMLPTYNSKQLKNQLVIGLGEIPPQQSEQFELRLFTGPKSLSLLKSLNVDLENAIDFGWVDFFAKPCLWFMNYIYGFIPNYGIAIIILTLVTRGMFWPLAKKSYTSMGEMRKLQPLMQELREKYKDDKARMNQELMTLYKTYKINPLGGCLPMVIQLPVFFALYRMLYQAIELRHAPFFGWITDLSAPDRLFHFGFSIPFMDPPYGIPILTIIMGASMLLQQKMTPSPGDPTQAKMMMLMPIVFTFIFINFSSGLVLYWLVSNIFSMAQQYYTQKTMK